jgi:hypothetical protein
MICEVCNYENIKADHKQANGNIKGLHQFRHLGN